MALVLRLEWKVLKFKVVDKTCKPHEIEKVTNKLYLNIYIYVYVN